MIIAQIFDKPFHDVQRTRPRLAKLGITHILVSPLFPYLLEGLPPVLSFGELVYQRAADYPDAYWKSMSAYDFPLAWSINRAFAWGGDMRGLQGRLRQVPYRY